MTGNDVYSVPEPYDRETADTCDYTPPRLALSTSNGKIIATIHRGSYDIAGYTLYVNDVEQSGISVGSDGTVSGYTLKGTESSVKLTITDAAGYTATATMSLTPTATVDDTTTTNNSKPSR